MSAPAPVLNNGLVARSWISAIPLVAALTAPSPAPVGLTVPADPTSWADSGFIQVLTTGGSPNPEYRLRQPVVTVITWATKIGSKKPPWATAGRLAEYVLAACYSEHQIREILAISAGGITYPSAQVIEVLALSEPREVPGDPAGYARYTFDFELLWVQP